MRHAILIILVLGLLLGSLGPSSPMLAQGTTLVGLLPDAEEIAPGLVVVNEGFRSLDEQAKSVSDPAEAAHLLANWGWQGNAFRFFERPSEARSETPDASVEVSITGFQ